MDLNELDVVTCRAVIADNHLGRVVYTYRAMPAAAPVHYLTEGERLLLMLPHQSELIAEIAGQVVALLVEDDNEHLRRSVLMTGLCGHPASQPWPAGLSTGLVYFELHSPLVRGRRTRLR
jgi:nitroimidazol reductase NimA-like FMN-containing flavoprotein (pyridoxamine 5'-phosphate oxidase superfamily)